jgi:trans-aconitate 2-methyltransferase
MRSINQDKISSVSNWQPELYVRFEAYRTRAARDLLAHIPFDDVEYAVDLGCGPGNSTVLLAERWPKARIVGVDNSSSMLDRASRTYPQFKWTKADIAQFQPDATPDLIFANASLQWVQDHARLLQRLGASLRKGGVLAFQVPYLKQQPVAEVYLRLINSDRWRHYPPPDERLTVEDPAFYYDVLAGCCKEAEVWETVYYHSLENHRAMVAWYQSTGLRPFLANLPDDETRTEFMEKLAGLYEKQFPPQIDGRVLFPFHRLFAVAVR